jgi:phosphatidate cytidylyltransferase
MAGLLTRALTVLIGVPVLLGWLWLAKTYDQFWSIVLLLACVTALASWEYATLVERSGSPLERGSFVVVSVLAIVAYGSLAEFFSLPIFVGAVLVLLARYVVQPQRIRAGATAVLGLIYIPYFLHFFYEIYRAEAGFYYALLLLLLVWAYDTGAFVVGSLWGRHKLFVELSPKKSWEGVLGGVVLALVAGWLSLLWMPFELSSDVAHHHALLMALLVSAFAQLGDLFESKLKRAAGVKDSGAFFPGHGGMLDRVDSLLLALPVFYFYVRYLLKWV